MEDFTKITTSQTKGIPGPGIVKRKSLIPAIIIIFLIVLLTLLLTKFKLELPKSLEDINVKTIHKAENKLSEPPQISSAQMVQIPIHEMINLNFKTKQEIYDLRKSFAAAYPQFIDSSYQPSEDIFRQITDGKPWWGILGRSYYGDGQYSIEGPAEESRFITNPLLLIALDSGVAWRVNDHNIPVAAIYPHPLSLAWSADHKRATVKYDVTTFRNEARNRLDPSRDKDALTLIGYNARDFGFHYLYVSPNDSQNVISVPHAVEILQFIHTGGSCGYPGGCNNMSPFQNELVIKVNELPAKAYIKLWRNEPANVSDKADMVYIIEMI